MKRYILLTCLVLMITLSYASTGFQEHTVNWLQNHHLSPGWIVLIISMIPVIELRGAIPVAILVFGFTWWQALLIAIIGNILPIPLVMLLWDRFVRLLCKTRLGKSSTDWVYNRTRRKSKLIEKYKAWGLAIFVGIPLPGTGGWTGALAAHIFGIKFWKSLLFILIGVIMAGIIVTILSGLGYLALK